MAAHQRTRVDRITLTDRSASPPRARTFDREPEVAIEGFHWRAWIRSARRRVTGWEARAAAGGAIIARGIVAEVTRVQGVDDGREPILKLRVAPPETPPAAH